MSEPQADVEMPKYQCHKVVHALQIERMDWTPGEGASLIVEGAFQPIDVTDEWVGRHAPASTAEMVGGYYVRYADGHTSYSPQQAFEAGYTRI